MKRPRYDDKAKSAILAAVQAGRNSGKPWSEVLKDAEAVGYHGNIDSLSQFVRSSTPAQKKAPAKSNISKPAATAPETPVQTSAPQVSAPTVTPQSPAPLDINGFFQQAVTNAVISALEQLLVSLKSGK